MPCAASCCRLVRVAALLALQRLRRTVDAAAGHDKGRRMTLLDDVAALVRRVSPEAICDDCIAQRLGLPLRQHANRGTRELSAERDYRRRKDRCGLCGLETLVIRYR